MILQVILEGIGLGVLLILVCAIGIRKGAVGMVHLYSQEVQERCVTLGLTTHAKIKRNALIFKAVCVPGDIAYVMAKAADNSVPDTAEEWLDQFGMMSIWYAFPQIAALWAASQKTNVDLKKKNVRQNAR